VFSAFIEIAPGRLRESVGLEFEAFTKGQVFHHRPGITVSQEENANEALATLNQAAVHYDLHYAANTEFGRALVVSTLTLQRALGMGWKTFGRRRRLLGLSDIRLTAPVFGGDTLYAATRVTSTRNDGEEAGAGILGCETTLTRSDGTVSAVVCYELSVFRAKHGPFAALGYLDAATAGGGHPSHAETAPGVFTETLGIEFDAFEPGLVIEHRPGFTFSWEEARYRAALAGDHAPLVTDRAFAEALSEGLAEINSPWIVGAFAAASTRAFGRVVANLAWKNVTFPNTVRDGDTVLAESEIVSKRASRSRPNQGVLDIVTRGFRRGDGAEVCRYERTLLVYRSPEGPHSMSGYA
jgi:itaconyl-CoA hydratase